MCYYKSIKAVVFVFQVIWKLTNRAWEVYASIICECMIILFKLYWERAFRSIRKLNRNAKDFAITHFTKRSSGVSAPIM